jgi:hypothetical protein
VPTSATRHLGRLAAHARDGVQPLEHRLARLQPPGDLVADPSDELVQGVEVGQLLGDQEALAGQPGGLGLPGDPHPVYGAHVALTVRLPEVLAHTAGAHSAEGERVTRNLENTTVTIADRASWRALNRAGALVDTHEAVAARRAGP